MTETKLPARVLKIIDRCRAGQVLRKSFRMKTNGEHEVEYAFPPSDKRASTISAEEAIASGLLIPNGDGLFDDSTSQTWRAPR